MQQIPLPPSRPSTSPNWQQTSFGPNPFQSSRAPDLANPQDSPFAAARGRYFPDRDPEHLEYNLASIGPVKKQLTAAQADILKLMILAFRYNLHVVEYPPLQRQSMNAYMVPDFKDRFAFDWKGKLIGHPYGIVEVILDNPLQSDNEAERSDKAGRPTSSHT